MSAFFKFFAEKGKVSSIDPFWNITRAVQLESEAQRPCVKTLVGLDLVDTMPVGSWFMEANGHPYNGVVVENSLLVHGYNEVPKSKLNGVLNGGLCNG